MMIVSKEKFVSFSDFEINNMTEHLRKPIENLHEGSPLAMNHIVSLLDELNSRSYGEQDDHQVIQKFKEDGSK